MCYLGHMKCSVCDSAACSRPSRCDDHFWVVPVIKELAHETDSDPVAVREALEEQIQLDDGEFFLMWKAAKLLQKWRAA